MDTDAEWEKWGSVEPYFGVITSEKFRSDQITQKSKDEFFESGRWHVRHVLDQARRYVDEGFAPKAVLDFGCGTGRLAIPFAEQVEHVTGLDVSKSMLDEAARNCDEHELKNLTLLKSDDELSCLEDSFDLIHSFVVFQHIPVVRGRLIFANLLKHLNPGGICAVHFTYSKEVFRENHGLASTIQKVKALKKKMRRKIRGHWRELKNVFSSKSSPSEQPQTSLDPEMQMNPYNMNELMFIIHSIGVHNVHTEFTDHGGEFGVFLYFQKPKG